MLTDIEIAQAASPLGIQDIAKKAGIPEDLLECYGNDKAKVALRFLNEDASKGKLVLVTAITPTPAGEGKTTTSIGLADGLRAIG
ncbi:MAG: formate--tetrahydrofolate ligase, partial [Lachnospiraceae bacterium]|nr:formate--tetrahydrofolate ligase [Lachnospiraceae bacterium]